ncbi:MAG: pyridoxamine 5'-phosphate oxidase family protein [Streptosporangiales bacterium]|nr:pyridoxamine 5'-phosphate oxidase family protein [Streptosporangiales bacterium]
MGTDGIHTLSRAACLRLLATVPVGRFVYTTAGLPAIVPVNFIVDSDRIVFRTSEGAKLVAVREGTVIAFQADDIDSVSRSGWSVTVVGKARLLEGPEADRFRSDLLRPWVGDTREDVVAIDITLVTGRRVGHVDSERLDRAG